MKQTHITYKRTPVTICLCLIGMAFCSTAICLVAGDVDMSGTVDSSDIQLVINAALGITVSYETDFDYSGRTDAIDIQLVINAALSVSVDSDGDGLLDTTELKLGTDPHRPDSDNDTIDDGHEMLEGSDPTLPDCYTQNIIINEFVASNRNGLQDEDGDFVDWIELYNAGYGTISLQGWTITDNEDEPYKWSFPDISLDSGGFIVVFASGKDRKPEDGGPLHTNFKLGRSGEFLALYERDPSEEAVTRFRPEFPEQRSDIAYARHGTGSDFYYFDEPTPGAPNTVSGSIYSGYTPDPMFSLERGFYDNPIDLAISVPMPDATTRYTLDGTEPLENHGSVYTEPIAITDNTVVRARAFTPGYLPSHTSTHTYLINVGTALKSLPALSIAGDPEEALYEPNGIMAIVGGVYESGYPGGDVWVPESDDDYNHPMQRGREYERQVSIECIGFSTQQPCQINCGIRVHGSEYHRARYRRDGDWLECRDNNYNKFSFKLYFRDDYGEDRLDFPLFGLSEVDRFDRLVLRGGHNDMCNPFIKDELVRRLHLSMGQIASHGTFVNLFINGEYKGYYNLCERIDEDFLQAWFGSDERWDVITPPDGTGYTEGYLLRDGDGEAWEALLGYIQGRDLSNSYHYEEISRRLDIEAFIDYLIVELYCANGDWPISNWVAARERTEGTEAGKFRFYVWDSEICFTPRYGSTPQSNGFYQFPFWRPDGGAGLNGEHTPLAWLYRALKVNPDFQQHFSARVKIHFYDNGALTNENVLARWIELRDNMAGVIPAMGTYIPYTFIPERRFVILEAFRTEGLLHD